MTRFYGVMMLSLLGFGTLTGCGAEPPQYIRASPADSTQESGSANGVAETKSKPIPTPTPAPNSNTSTANSMPEKPATVTPAPAPQPSAPPAPKPADDPALLAQEGVALYGQKCAGCHGAYQNRNPAVRMKTVQQIVNARTLAPHTALANANDWPLTVDDPNAKRLAAALK